MLFTTVVPGLQPGGSGCVWRRESTAQLRVVSLNLPCVDLLVMQGGSKGTALLRDLRTSSSLLSTIRSLTKGHHCLFGSHHVLVPNAFSQYHLVSVFSFFSSTCLMSICSSFIQSLKVQVGICASHFGECPPGRHPACTRVCKLT